MTMRSDFKRKVRARVAMTGESYSTARRKVLEQPPPPPPPGKRQGWSVAEMLWAEKQARDGAPCVKAAFAIEATADELAFGFVACAIPNPGRMGFEPSRMQAVAVEFNCIGNGWLLAVKLTDGGYMIRPPQMHPIGIEDVATLDALHEYCSGCYRRSPEIQIRDPYTDYGGPGKTFEDLCKLAEEVRGRSTLLVPADDPAGGPYSWPMLVDNARATNDYFARGWRAFANDLPG